MTYATGAMFYLPI